MPGLQVCTTPGYNSPYLIVFSKFSGGMYKVFLFIGFERNMYDNNSINNHEVFLMTLLVRGVCLFPISIIWLSLLQ